MLQAGVSQREVARRFNVHPCTINRCQDSIRQDPLMIAQDLVNRL